jgi:hypothetical protein
MDKQTLQLLGTIALLAGLFVAGLGANKIAMNLPVSDEQALEEAKMALMAQEGLTGSRTGESLRGDVELQVWESATESRNEIRTKMRSEGSVLLVIGLIGVVWGVAMLYYGGITPGGA